MSRSIKQLITHDNALMALCEDGSLWRLSERYRDTATWLQLPVPPEIAEGKENTQPDMEHG